jgi:hypothetical protein
MKSFKTMSSKFLATIALGVLGAATIYECAKGLRNNKLYRKIRDRRKRLKEPMSGIMAEVKWSIQNPNKAQLQ